MLGVARSFIMFRRWEERPNERVITGGIGGWFLLASATSGYIKLAYCSSTKGAPVAQW